MADGTKISWCDATWNPVSGCRHVSPGCDNCYAAKMASRGFPRWRGLAERGRWTGRVRLHADKLDAPLRWGKSRRVFVCSMGDLFYPVIEDEWRDDIFRVMLGASQHTYLVLTKRPNQMAAYFERRSELGQRISAAEHIWLGVTAEDQERADKRIPDLLAISAAVHFVSIEPLIGPVDITRHLTVRHDTERGMLPPLSWLIVGGESGSGARCMRESWVRDLVCQVNAAKVAGGGGPALYVKQMGSAWAREHGSADSKGHVMADWPADFRVREYPQDIHRQHVLGEIA